MLQAGGCQQEVYACDEGEEMSEWQPIETAPKDGTRIVLATSDTAYAGRWAESQYIGMWWMSGDYVAAFSKMNPPTHWMPLPQPPKEDK